MKKAFVKNFLARAAEKKITRKYYIFIVESVSTLKIRMFAKKIKLKILKFGRMVAIFAKMKIFDIFFKDLISRRFLKFF